MSFLHAEFNTRERYLHACNRKGGGGRGGGRKTIIFEWTSKTHDDCSGTRGGRSASEKKASWREGSDEATCQALSKSALWHCGARVCLGWCAASFKARGSASRSRNKLASFGAGERTRETGREGEKEERTVRGGAGARVPHLLPFLETHARRETRRRSTKRESFLTRERAEAGGKRNKEANAVERERAERKTERKREREREREYAATLT